MNIQFFLGGYTSGSDFRKAFKSEAAFLLFADYLTRLKPFATCSVLPLAKLDQPSSSKRWICHTDSQCKPVSSDALAKKISECRDSGIRNLQILIGGADGFEPEEIQRLKPDFIWNFGPLTYPHELAAIVAAEQIYRAWTILHGMPYHKGHSRGIIS